MIGRTLSHYRIIEQIGSGGMGVVYAAEDTRLGRRVALKFVSGESAHDTEAIQRLRSEARAASALNHPNICTIYDIGEADDHPFIVMELMTGESLRDRLSEGALRVARLIEIGVEVADALHAAHSQGIIHRDIKPGNIFLTDHGHVKILDFGLAKLTAASNASLSERTGHTSATGVTHGTPAYMSPEQATAEVLDGRTDLFSLGVVLYEAATGHHPFTGKTSAVVVAGILDKTPVSPQTLNPDLPSRLVEIIGNCLEKDRELRYQSAADLRADLKRLRRDLDASGTRAIDRSATMELRRAAPGGVFTTSDVVTTAETPSRPEVLAQTRPPATTQSSLGVVPTVVGAVLLAGLAWWAFTSRSEVAPTPQPTVAVGPPPVPAAEPPASSVAAPAVEQPQTAAKGRPVPAAPRAGGGAPPPAPPPASPRPGSAAAAKPPIEPPSPPPAPVLQPSPTAPAPEVPPPTVRSETAAPLREPVRVEPPASTTPEVASPPPPSPAKEQDDVVIRRVVSTYGRAIEAKDVALFRSVKPNMSDEELRRLQAGFRAVSSQRVSLTVVALERRDDRATVTLQRRDEIEAGGRKQTADSRQVLIMRRVASGWVIDEIR